MIAHRISKGKEVDIDSSLLQKDYLIIIKPGESIPADGVVSEGHTTVSEEKLRGEARPIDKLPRSLVYAGSVNGDKRIVVRVTATGEDTWQARLAKAQASAASSVANEEHCAKRTAKRAPFIIVVLAVLSGVAWYHAGLFAAVIAALAVFLAGSPYIFLAKSQGVYAKKIRELAASGALLKDASTLEKLEKVKTLVFDRTGVLTSASLKVEHVVSFRPYTQQQVLNLAATLEQQSTHPLAVTIVSFAKSFGAAAFQKINDLNEESGLGVSGVLNGKNVSVGGASYMQKKRIKLPLEATTHKEEGKTVIYVVSEKVVMGYIALSDELREDSGALSDLKKDYRLVLLTGDHQETAVAVAAKAGMHEALPVKKAEQGAELSRLKNQGLVAHVTLAASSDADITITLGKEFADVTLLRPDVSLLKKVLESSKECRSYLRKKFRLACGYHVIMLPLACVMPLWLGPWSLAVSLGTMGVVTMLFFTA